MTDRDHYAPGHAADAAVEKDGDRWTLVLTRHLRHPPALVWEALTDPEQLAAWAPFDADRNLATPGPMKLATVGAPQSQTADCIVKRAEAERVLEYSWGDNDLRWELEPQTDGTKLTLWHTIDRRFIAWGAAGWHICFDVLMHLLNADPIGRIVGADAMHFDWQRLNEEYAKAFGITTKPFPGA